MSVVRTKIGLNRLNKMDRVMSKLSDKQFTYKAYIKDRDEGKLSLDEHKCGTAACAVGWMPYIFPSVFKKTKNNLLNIPMKEHVENFFGISMLEYEDVFEGKGLLPWLAFPDINTGFKPMEDISLKEFLETRLRPFIKFYEKELKEQR